MLSQKKQCVYFKGNTNAFVEKLCNDNNIDILPALNNTYYLSVNENEILQLNIPELSKHPIPQLNEKHFNISHKSIAGKALGKKTRVVIDATAGLGGDSIMFAKMGFEVIAIERQAYTFLLLNDNIHQNGLDHKVTTIFGNSVDIIANENLSYDAVFFDPMYPEKEKKALPNIRMRALALLSKDKDDDFQQIFSRALTIKNKRIVVKRPDHSPVLEENRLLHSYKGKSVRYDAY